MTSWKATSKESTQSVPVWAESLKSMVLLLRKTMDFESDVRQADATIAETGSRVHELRGQVAAQERRIVTQIRAVPNQYSVERLTTMLFTPSALAFHQPASAWRLAGRGTPASFRLATSTFTHHEKHEVHEKHEKDHSVSCLSRFRVLRGYRKNVTLMEERGQVISLTEAWNWCDAEGAA